jgi:hypothetical protein
MKLEFLSKSYYKLSSVSSIVLHFCRYWYIKQRHHATPAIASRRLTPDPLPRPPSHALKDHSPNNAGRNSHTTQYSHTHQTFFRNPIINQTPQAGSLHVCRLFIQQ